MSQQPIDYSPHGRGKMVVLIIKFRHPTGASREERRKRNVDLTRQFKGWLADRLRVMEDWIGHQAGDVNHVEFGWYDELNDAAVNAALSDAPQQPNVAKLTIRFQNQSGVTI